MTGDSSSNAPSPDGSPQPLPAQSVSGLVLHLEHELERLKRDNAEVEQLRKAQQHSERLQTEIEEVKAKYALLEIKDHDLENAIIKLREDASSLQAENRALQASNTQLRSNITQLDAEIAHLKHLRRENEELRKRHRERNAQKESQLQHTINLRLDLMNATAAVDTILEHLSETPGGSGPTSPRAAADCKADSKDEPSPIIPRRPASPISPLESPSSTFSSTTTKARLCSLSRSPPRGPAALPARPDLKIRITAPLQDRITPAPTPDHRTSYRRGDKRHRDSWSPRRSGYDSASDGEYGYSRSHSSRYAPRRRSEADHWP